LERGASRETDSRVLKPPISRAKDIEEGGGDVAGEAKGAGGFQFETHSRKKEERLAQLLQDSSEYSELVEKVRIFFLFFLVSFSLHPV